MAYKAGPTNIPGGSFRPWQSRLGDYSRATFYTPTPTVAYQNQPVTGGLGQIDFSAIPWWGWAAAAIGGWMLFRGRRR